MYEKQTPMTLALVGALAGTVTVVAFLMLLVMGGYAFSPAAFLAILIGLIVAIVLFVGFHTKPAPRAAAPVAHAVPKPMAEAAPVARVVATPAPAPVVAPAPAAAPVAAAPVVAGASRKPEALTAARGGKADDLKIIKGIGPKLEELCHRLGFFHFDQVANWTAEEVAWVDENLEGFKGRVTRDRWVPQAKAIVAVGPTEFLRRLDAGEEF